MADLKTGSRLRSAACTTEVMVISVPGEEFEVSCGGVQMIGVAQTPAGGLSVLPDAAEGTKLGKRYINDGGALELLCTNSGDGALATNMVMVQHNEAKNQPSSD